MQKYHRAARAFKALLSRHITTSSRSESAEGRLSVASIYLQGLVVVGRHM